MSDLANTPPGALNCRCSNVSSVISRLVRRVLYGGRKGRSAALQLLRGGPEGLDSIRPSFGLGRDAARRADRWFEFRARGGRLVWDFADIRHSDRLVERVVKCPPGLDRQGRIAWGRSEFGYQRHLKEPGALVLTYSDGVVVTEPLDRHAVARCLEKTGIVDRATVVRHRDSATRPLTLHHEGGAECWIVSMGSDVHLDPETCAWVLS